MSHLTNHTPIACITYDSTILLLSHITHHASHFLHGCHRVPVECHPMPPITRLRSQNQYRNSVPRAPRQWLWLRHGCFPYQSPALAHWMTTTRYNLRPRAPKVRRDDPVLCDVYDTRTEATRTHRRVWHHYCQLSPSSTVTHQPSPYRWRTRRGAIFSNNAHTISFTPASHQPSPRQ
eukprot:COSAG02_NODE_7518_length_2976_cov_2.274939_1_plen_177_part_00